MLPAKKSVSGRANVELDRAARLATVRVHVALTRYDSLVRGGGKWQRHVPLPTPDDHGVAKPAK